MLGRNGNIAAEDNAYFFIGRMDESGDPFALSIQEDERILHKNAVLQACTRGRTKIETIGTDDRAAGAVDAPDDGIASDRERISLSVEEED